MMGYFITSSLMQSNVGTNIKSGVLNLSESKYLFFSSFAKINSMLRANFFELSSAMEAIRFSGWESFSMEV
nr:hypothetical protein GTC16762_06130 [Pigmentibacter ruber]